MYFLFKMGIFHCSVCLPEGINDIYWITTSQASSSVEHPASSPRKRKEFSVPKRPITCRACTNGAGFRWGNPPGRSHDSRKMFWVGNQIWRFLQKIKSKWFKYSGPFLPSKETKRMNLIGNLKQLENTVVVLFYLVIWSFCFFSSLGIQPSTFQFQTIILSNHVERIACTIDWNR